MIKQAIMKLKKEFEELAVKNEQQTHQKCAQVLLAASGLEVLRKKLTTTQTGD